jgi:anti-sigma B factor antagonist
MGSAVASNPQAGNPRVTAMTAESTVVFADRVVKITSVQTTSSDEWRAAVSLRGELDVANAHELREELTRHLDEGRRVLRVDVRRVEFMDSTAIGELITASERCRSEHGSLILTGVQRRLLRLLTIAGLDQVLLVDTAANEAEQSAAV